MYGVLFFILFLFFSQTFGGTTPQLNCPTISAQWVSDTSPSVQLHPIRNGQVTQNEYYQISFLSMEQVNFVADNPYVSTFIDLTAYEFQFNTTESGGLMASTSFNLPNNSLNGTITVFYNFNLDSTNISPSPGYNYTVPANSFSFYVVVNFLNSPAVKPSSFLLLNFFLQMSNNSILQPFLNPPVTSLNFVASDYGALSSFLDVGTTDNSLFNVTFNFTSLNSSFSNMNVVFIDPNGYTPNAYVYAYQFFTSLSFLTPPPSPSSGSLSSTSISPNNNSIWVFILLILVSVCCLIVGLIILAVYTFKKKEQDPEEMQQLQQNQQTKTKQKDSSD